MKMAMYARERRVGRVWDGRVLILRKPGCCLSPDQGGALKALGYERCIAGRRRLSVQKNRFLISILALSARARRSRCRQSLVSVGGKVTRRACGEHLTRALGSWQGSGQPLCSAVTVHLPLQSKSNCLTRALTSPHPHCTPPTHCTIRLLPRHTPHHRATATTAPPSYPLRCSRLDRIASPAPRSATPLGRRVSHDV